MHRFYVPDLPQQGDPAPLPPEEAQHLLRVLRLEKGETVRAFDGRGREHLASVEALSKSDAIIRIGEPAVPAAEPRVRITLAQSLLKGDKFDEVVRDSTMMSAHHQYMVASTINRPGARIHQLTDFKTFSISGPSSPGCMPSVKPNIMMKAPSAPSAGQGLGSTRW